MAKNPNTQNQQDRDMDTDDDRGASSDNAGNVANDSERAGEAGARGGRA